MKKYFFTLLILGLICFPHVQAQTYGNDSNVGAGTGNGVGGSTQVGPVVPIIQGQIGGGTQDTTPINDNPPSNTTTPTSQPVSSTNTCTTVRFTSLIDILVWIKCLITSLFIPLLFAAAFVFFLWGVIRYMTSSDNVKKEESKKYIWYGLIGLFVMVSVWGIIKIAAGVFGFDAGIPYLPTQYLK